MRKVHLVVDPQSGVLKGKRFAEAIRSYLEGRQRLGGPEAEVVWSFCCKEKATAKKIATIAREKPLYWIHTVGDSGEGGWVKAANDLAMDQADAVVGWSNADGMLAAKHGRTLRRIHEGVHPSRVGAAVQESGKSKTLVLVGEETAVVKEAYSVYRQRGGLLGLVVSTDPSVIAQGQLVIVGVGKEAGADDREHVLEAQANEVPWIAPRNEQLRGLEGGLQCWSAVDGAEAIERLESDQKEWQELRKWGYIEFLLEHDWSQTEKDLQDLLENIDGGKDVSGESLRATEGQRITDEDGVSLVPERLPV